MFNGSTSRRRVVDLGGTSRRQGRDDFLQKTQRDRANRAEQRRQEQAAITVQAFYRGRTDIGRFRNECRVEWDAALEPLRTSPSGVGISRVLALLRDFNFFYREAHDADRFAHLCTFLLPQMSSQDAVHNLTSAALDEQSRERFVFLMKQFMGICARRAHHEGMASPPPARLTLAFSMLLCVPEGARWVLRNASNAAVIDTVCARIQQSMITGGLMLALRPYLCYQNPTGRVSSDPLMTSVATNLLVRPFKYPLPNPTAAFRSFASVVYSVPLLRQRLSSTLVGLLYAPHIWDGVIRSLPEGTVARDDAAMFGPEEDRGTGSDSLSLPPACSARGDTHCNAADSLPSAAWLFGNIISCGSGHVDTMDAGALNNFIRVLSLLHNAVPRSFFDPSDGENSQGEYSVAGNVWDTAAGGAQLREQLEVLATPAFVRRVFAGIGKPGEEGHAELLQLCSLYNSLMRGWPSMRLELLNTLTFSTRLVPSLWSLVVNMPELDSFANHGEADDGLLVSLLTFFLECSNHLFKTMDDDEFFKQTFFTVADVVYLSEILKRLVVRMYWGGQFSRATMTSASDLHLRKMSTELLSWLHRRDARRRFCPEGHWTASFFDRREQFSREYLELGQLNPEARTSLILRYLPFLVPFSERVLIFRSLIAQERASGMGGGVTVTVRRDHLFEDGFEKLNHLQGQLRNRVQVTFVDAMGMQEAGIDGGGVFKEFLTSLVKTAYDPNYGLFVETPERLLYPNYLSEKLYGRHLSYFEFLGRIAGKALWEGILVDLPLAGFFLSKLLGQINLVNDLGSLDPELHKNLLFLKSYDGDWADLHLTFTVQEGENGEIETELKPNGKDIMVDGSNVNTYIILIANYRLNEQIRSQSNAFSRGMGDVIDLNRIRLFDQNELRILLSGTETQIDLDDLRRNTHYSGGYHDQHPLIMAFWRVVGTFDESERASLLKFATSCSRPPLLGFKELNPSFCIHSAGEHDDRLPTASTCMNLLKIPLYPDELTLRDKLIYAINANSGFDLS